VNVVSPWFWCYRKELPLVFLPPWPSHARLFRVELPMYGILRFIIIIIIIFLSMVAEKIYIKLEVHLSDSHMRDLSPSLNILARDTRANRPKFLLWRARVIPALASLNFLYLRHIKMHIFYVLFLFFSFFSLGYCPSLLIFIFN
jgi:hypothetical protein